MIRGCLRPLNRLPEWEIHKSMSHPGILFICGLRVEWFWGLWGQPQAELALGIMGILGEQQGLYVKALSLTLSLAWEVGAVKALSLTTQNHQFPLLKRCR